MAKRYKTLFPRIYDFGNLYNAYLLARRNKRYKKEALLFRQRLEENLIQIQNELIWKTYRTGNYRTFYVYEPKARLVAALPFRDRVVHHAIVSVIEPIWEKRFIFDSYACRVDKGTHAGANRTQKFLQSAKHNWRDVYCLKGDVSKYFYTIDHSVLKTLLHKRIACRNTSWLLSEIIDSTSSDLLENNLQKPAPKSVPIGNLTSQLFANIYLHELDKFIKYELKERYYVRYMDDFVILGDSKAHLHKIRIKIHDFLYDNLKLKLNGKTQVFLVQGKGIDFLGYRIWPTHRLLRNASKRRIKRKLKRYKALYDKGKMSQERINASIQSWLGHMKHCNSFRLEQKLLKSITIV